MTEERGNIGDECATARATLHALFDEDGPGGELPAHLAHCASCRDWARDMGELRGALRNLDHPPLPESALREVWERTVDRPRWRLAVPAWTWAAAAAVLVALIGLGIWGSIEIGHGSGTRAVAEAKEEPTDMEIRQAAEEVRMAFAIASSAVRRSERAVVDRVLAGQVTPALDRIVVEWPAAGPPEPEGRNGV